MKKIQNLKSARQLTKAVLKQINGGNMRCNRDCISDFLTGKSSLCGSTSLCDGSGNCPDSSCGKLIS